jgi:hypothetical protein
MSRKHRPVLIIGGSGIVGSQAATAIRRLHPNLPVMIGGRDLAKAQAVAARLDGVEAAAVDLDDGDLGLPAEAAFGAIIVFVKDNRLNALRYAQDHSIPHVSVSSGTFEIGLEVAQHIHRPDSSAVMLASQWLAGAALFPTLHYAKAYRQIETIRLGFLLDEQDMGGPAAWADFERITKAATAVLTLEEGQFTWIGGDKLDTSYRSVDGVVRPARAYSPFDVLSLAAATNARNIRVDLAFDVSASRRRGEPFSTETVIEIEGTTDAGPARTRHEIVHPAGQAPLTALGVALITERALGLAGGPPLKPGLYFPDTVIDPAYYLERMKEFGATFRTVAP